MSGSSITVTVVGTSITTTVDPSGAFKLQHVPAGDDDLDFEGAEVHARIHVAGVTEREDIVLRIVIAGGSADVDISERHSSDNRVEIEGRIAEVNAAARTLRIGDTLVMVPAGTPIRHGGTPVDFAQLRVGDRVHAQATMNGTAITATEVMLQTEHGNPEPGEDHGEVELKGTISGKSGTCPSLIFTVSSTMVTTNASTKFDETPCTALANGDQVEIEGTRQANGSVLATKVEVKKAENEKVELSGTLSAKAGTCPALTFMVSSTNVATNASTKFKDAACGTLMNGDRVEVEGTRQSNGTVLATQVEKKK
jgi:Domain of unknown function (DUF5666)